jgi:hypothetical protein
MSPPEAEMSANREAPSVELSISPARQRVRGLALNAFFAAYIFIVLALDATASRMGQHALGVVTFALLIAVSRAYTPDERREMWWCVAFSTCIELLATQLWGLYHYRLGNVPLYVPPGHGLIYLIGTGAVRANISQRARRSFVWGALAVATGWAASGLTILRASSGRLDVHGALYWPFFVWYLLRSPHAIAYVATFAITSWIELVGVRFGVWHWSAVMPGLSVPSGDPPSLIAGGYCFFGVVAQALARLHVKLRSRAPSP